MAGQLNTEEFLNKAAYIPLLDVRTPAEYAGGHIPGAINFPLFSDEERAIIGTLYKKEGQKRAILRGLDLIGPRMRQMLTNAEKIAPKGEVIVHCWRGGMRSGSVAWLLQLYGFQVSILKGGYKAYRNWVLDTFKENRKLVVLGGSTGSAKTLLLQLLREHGEQKIDLEAMAHHKGSAFGALGEQETTQEQFENELAEAWSRLDPARPVWVEDESRTIGKKVIPEPIWRQMRQAQVILLQRPLEERVMYLVKEYGTFPKEELAGSILRIRKRLGGLAFQQALEALDNNDLATTARLLLDYYDKAYAMGLSHRQPETIHAFDGAGMNDNEIAKQMVALRKRIIL